MTGTLMGKQIKLQDTYGQLKAERRREWEVKSRKSSLLDVGSDLKIMESEQRLICAQPARVWPIPGRDLPHCNQ